MEILGQKTNKLDTEICLHAIDILHLKMIHCQVLLVELIKQAHHSDTLSTQQKLQRSELHSWVGRKVFELVKFLPTV